MCTPPIESKSSMSDIYNISRDIYFYFALINDDIFNHTFNNDDTYLIFLSNLLHSNEYNNNLLKTDLEIIESKNFSKEYFFPMEVAHCGKCNMVQLIETPERELMFNENYAFFS